MINFFKFIFWNISKIFFYFENCKSNKFIFIYKINLIFNIWKHTNFHISFVIYIKNTPLSSLTRFWLENIEKHFPELYYLIISFLFIIYSLEIILILI